MIFTLFKALLALLPALVMCFDAPVFWQRRGFCCRHSAPIVLRPCTGDCGWEY
jgi:hypothetical protein